MKQKQTIKLNESQLRDIIKEALNEFRGDFYSDGDVHYISPSGRRGKSDWRDTKRVMDNRHFNGKRSEHPMSYPSISSNGKGSLCYEAILEIEKILQVNPFSKEQTGKIEWTEKELELINKVVNTLASLATLSKQEGNKKRGYNGINL